MLIKGWKNEGYYYQYGSLRILTLAECGQVRYKSSKHGPPILTHCISAGCSREFMQYLIACLKGANDEDATRSSD